MSLKTINEQRKKLKANMAGQPMFGLISLILTAGACVMTFLILLAGTKDVTPLNQVFFLWADTSDIPNAPSLTKWTLWNFCEDADGLLSNCGKVKAAHPFLPQNNFGTTRNVPEDFLDHHRTYYYLSRIMFAFYLISIFFMICSLFTGLLALCSRLGSAISSLSAAVALFSMSLTASLMTAVFIMGRNAFRDDGHAAQVGLKAFAFTWASVAALFLAMVFYCGGFCSGRRRRHHHHDKPVEPVRTSRFGFFRRRREVV